MNCPLCESENIKILEIVSAKQLAKLYQEMTSLDLSYLLEENLEYCGCNQCKLKFFNPLVSGDEKFYNSLQVFDWYYLDEKVEFLEATKYISVDDKVLEVGSGRGSFVKYLPTQQYIGLDFSTKAKKMAEQDGIVIENEMVQDYAERNPGSFDVVVSFQVLEHVPNPKSFIEAKIKSLAVGGKMIIAVPSEDSFLRYVQNGILNMPPHHVTRWSDDTLKFIATEYNLELINIYHEKLQDIHKQWFLQTLISSSIVKPRLLNNSFMQKIIIKTAYLLSQVIVKGLRDELLPNGHTVMAVYKKR